MQPNTEKLLEKATKEELTEALLSACSELADLLRGHDMYVNEEFGYVAAGTLNNQVLYHLSFPDTIFEDELGD
jgi:hypothetical protein